MSFMPSPFAGSSFWTTSMSWFLMRTGGMLVLVSLAWIWMQRPGAAHWSPMLIFGRTSLFVWRIASIGRCWRFRASSLPGTKT